MAKQEHYMHAIAHQVLGETRDKSKELAQALQPPDDGASNVKISDAEYQRYFRRSSLTDPTFAVSEYDRVAPVALDAPGYPPMRARAGLERWVQTIKAARPDVYAAVMGQGG